jgi:hypothetical protein
MHADGRAPHCFACASVDQAVARVVHRRPGSSRSSRSSALTRQEHGPYLRAFACICD